MPPRGYGPGAQPPFLFFSFIAIPNVRSGEYFSLEIQTHVNEGYSLALSCDELHYHGLPSGNYYIRQRGKEQKYVTCDFAGECKNNDLSSVGPGLDSG